LTGYTGGVSGSRAVYRWAVTGFLAAAVLLAHGWCLNDGTVLDDHQHQKALREHGWSLAELQRSLVIEPSQWMHHWWQNKPVRWEYARPLFILTMKVVYHVIGGDDPWFLHAYSLMLHFLCSVMVWRLCLWAGADRLWSAVGALLFIVYPHAVMTVQWSSSQNCVQQTALTLAALLAYLRTIPRDDPQIAQISKIEEKTKVPSPSIPICANLRNLWIVVSVLCWTAALLTKENAIVLPAILLAIDWIFAGRKHTISRWPAYAAFAILGTAFVAYRAAGVTIGMPDVYFRRPEGDFAEYATWCVAKLLHYLCTSIWPAPMMIGPTGRYNPWSEATADTLAMLAIVATLVVAYAVTTRGVRGRWIWPLWILLAVLPVTPVIATAHSGYFAGVGFSAALALACSAGRPIGLSRPRLGIRVARAIAVIDLVVFSGLTMLNRWQWTGIIAAERYVPAWVASSPPVTRASDVFFINLPFVNIYAKPALVHTFDPALEQARFHVLTYAPQPVLLEQRSYVEQIDGHSFAVSIVGQPYFSRLLGRFLVDGFRREGAFVEGQTIAADGFDVRIAEANDEGVQSLIFTFPRRLDDPAYCFYLTSIDCGAARLRFGGNRPHASAAGSAARPGGAGPSGTPIGAAGTAQDATHELSAAISRLETGDASAAEVVFRGRRAQDWNAFARATESFRRVAGAVAQATGSRLQDVLLGPPTAVDELAPPPRISPPQPKRPLPPISEEEWRAIEDWWRSEVDDDVLTAVWWRQPAFQAYVKAREEVPHARQWAALLVRTDLYLTGPPFPGPRVRK
jgi:hypothetical protein